MTQAANFRAKAGECETNAQQAKDAEAKRLLREAAEQWLLMVAHAERHGW
jgi:hypothetical protein